MGTPEDEEEEKMMRRMNIMTMMARIFAMSVMMAIGMMRARPKLKKKADRSAGIRPQQRRLPKTGGDDDDEDEDEDEEW